MTGASEGAGRGYVRGRETANLTHGYFAPALRVKSGMKKPSLSPHGIARVRALMDHSACPTAFPVVRTRFLGNIATPRLDASPVQTVTSL